jgi:uncharacterized membrane protein
MRARVTWLMLAAMLVVPSPAWAWMQFCNQTKNPVWVSVAFQGVCQFWGCGDTGCGDANFDVFGWFHIAPGACSTVANGDMYYFNGYFYAEDDAGDVWSGWDPVYTFCTPWTAFNYCSNLSEKTCSTESRMLTYEYIPNISYDNFTVNLTP